MALCMQHWRWHSTVQVSVCDIYLLSTRMGRGWRTAVHQDIRVVSACSIVHIKICSSRRIFNRFLHSLRWWAWHRLMSQCRTLPTRNRVAMRRTYLPSCHFLQLVLYFTSCRVLVSFHLSPCLLCTSELPSAQPQRHHGSLARDFESWTGWTYDVSTCQWRVWMGTTVQFNSLTRSHWALWG